MELLSTDVAERGGWTVVTATGQLDVATAPALHQTLTRAQLGDDRAVVLDLDGIEFVDDLGLGVLLGAVKRARESGGRFVVVATRPRLTELFDLTGLHLVLDLAPDVATALDGGR